MSALRWSIASLMWVVLFAAIGLVAARGFGRHVSSPGEGLFWILLAAMVAGMGWILLSHVWFHAVPRWSLALAGGDLERQARILRSIVDTPGPARMKITARFLLAEVDLLSGRYDEAVAGFRSILGVTREGMDLLPGFESLLRQDLAEALEALGRPEEAAAERKRAAETLADEEDDETLLGLRSRGQLLECEHRHAEAAEAYEGALRLSSPDPGPLHLDLIMRLVISTSNAGRPAEALRWAEEAIALDPESPMIPMARRLAAVSCSSLGRLGEAERHARAGADLAPTPEDRGEALAILSEYAMRRGGLDEAERVAREAEALLGGRSRSPWLALAQIERERGRLEESIRAHEHARAIVMSPIPAAQRRLDAVIDRSLAILHAELGHREAALELIGRAEAGVAGDSRLSASTEAHAALVHALLGDRDAARGRIEAADRGRREVPDDGLSQRSILSLLGWAALAADEPDRAGAFLREYLDLRPDPLYLPYAWYHLGGCRLRLGDEEGVRECDARAASTDFGTRWERLARDRLTAGGSVVPAGAGPGPASPVPDRAG